MSTKRTTAPDPTTHDDDCDQPGLIWQGVYREGWPRLGICPTCGASSVDRPVPPTDFRPATLPTGQQ